MTSSDYSWLLFWANTVRLLALWKENHSISFWPCVSMMLIISCFKAKMITPLNCWHDVSTFSNSKPNYFHNGFYHELTLQGKTKGDINIFSWHAVPHELCHPNITRDLEPFIEKRPQMSVVRVCPVDCGVCHVGSDQRESLTNNWLGRRDWQIWLVWFQYSLSGCLGWVDGGVYI